MIRVAQVVGYMNGGGVEQVVMNYYRHLDRFQVQFDFLVCEGSTFVPRDEIEFMGGRVFMVPPYGQLSRYMQELERLFRSERWPIVHSHVNTISVFPLRAAKRAGVPERIAHSHTRNGGSEGEAMRDALKTILRRFSNVYPTYRFACGERAGGWLFGHAPFEIVPNAVDLSEFHPGEQDGCAMRAELGIPEEAFVLGHIGRMEPVKNHRRLLSIFSALLESTPDALLVFVGDGALMDNVRVEAARIGIESRVLFLGQRPDAARLYRAFDVFCLPSVYEGFPVVAVECQASGTPILASDAVSPEVAVTSLMEFEPLGSSDQEWACHILAMKGRCRARSDKEGLREFDIVKASRQLLEKYLSLSCEVQDEDGDLR